MVKKFSKLAMQVYCKFVMKFNHIAFAPIYKRLPEFFHQFPALKAISLLRQNYEWTVRCYAETEKMNIRFLRRISELEKERANERMRALNLNREEAMIYRRIFGVEVPSNQDN